MVLFISGLVVGAVVTLVLGIWFSKHNQNTIAKARAAEQKIVDKIQPKS